MTNIKPLTLAADLDPWEKQPGESARRHGQFRVYLELGRARSVQKASTKQALSGPNLRAVAAAHRWLERAEAYDLDQDRQRDAAFAEERRKAAEVDASLLRTGTAKVYQWLAAVDPTKLTESGGLRLMDLTLRHRRVLFGDVTETIAITGGGDVLAGQMAEFAGLTPEERSRRLAVLAAAVARRVRAVNGSDDEDDDDQGDDGDDGQEDEEEQASQGEDGGEGDGGGA